MDRSNYLLRKKNFKKKEESILTELHIINRQFQSLKRNYVMINTDFSESSSSSSSSYI